MHKRNTSFDLDGKKILLVTLGILTILLFVGGWIYDVQMAETRTPEQALAEATVIEAKTNMLNQVEAVIGTSGEAALTSGPFLLYAGGGLLMTALAIVILGAGISWAVGHFVDKAERSAENFANNGFVYQRTRKDGRQSSFMLASKNSSGSRPATVNNHVRMIEPERPKLPDTRQPDLADRFKELTRPDQNSNKRGA